MADNFFVTAILVSHYGATWLPEAIAAISAQSRKIDRIVAVDTGSLDNSVKMLTSAGLTVIKTDRDAGFGDAIALALGSAKRVNRDDSEELIWILHDDCAPTRSALESLIAGLEDKPQVAFVGPKLRGWYDRKHLLEVGISIAPNGARWTGLDPREHDQGQFDEPTEVLAVSTAAMLARRKIFEDLGGLDPNLALFRDDVDLGWRARVAGFSVMTAPEALVYHAEAAASERRSVDVEEAFLHRPRLLDRKNAAFVLLANASWWLLPWVALQIIGSSLIRAIGYLAAKLPGYAADEIAAVGLILIKPRDLLAGRKLRREKRLLSPRTVRQFIPPLSSQVRLSAERASATLRKFFEDNQREDERSDTQISYSDIGVIDESFDDQDLLTKSSRSNWQTIRNRPLLFGLGATLLISLIASRNRFGSISGGALAVSPNGAMELIAKYSESWHLVGMGSAATTPPWVAILGAASAITFGKVWLLISLFFILAPTLAFFVMYRSAKRVGVSIFFSVVGGLLYAMSPVIWSSINQGRLGTLVIALVAPSFLSILPRTLEIEAIGWRKIYFITLLAAFLAAFSPLFLVLWTISFLALLLTALIQRRIEILESGIIQFIVGAELGRIKRLFALALIPGLLNAPWSTSVVLHPTQILLEPGLPVSGGSLLNILTLNPGGLTAVPAWIFSPFIIFLVVLALNKRYALEASLAFTLFSIALIISQANNFGHGSDGKIWTGTLIVFIQILILIPILQISENLIPNLRASKLGSIHAISVVAMALTIFTVFGTGIWAVTNGANSMVSANKKVVVPAFIGSLSDTPARPKTIVIAENENKINYYITRGSDLEIGDPDVAVAIPTAIKTAVVELISGASVNSSQVFGAFGIKYIYFKNPVEENIARTIDGIGGFTRSSATNSGVIWEVVGSSPRVTLTDSSGKVLGLNSSKVGAVDEITSIGTIKLAEKFDSGWKLLVNGNQVGIQESDIGLPFFEVNETGPMTLLHDGTRHRALISAQLIALLTVIILSLPAGRRRREVPLEELA